MVSSVATIEVDGEEVVTTTIDVDTVRYCLRHGLIEDLEEAIEDIRESVAYYKAGYLG